MTDVRHSNGRGDALEKWAADKWNAERRHQREHNYDLELTTRPQHTHGPAFRPVDATPCPLNIEPPIKVECKAATRRTREERRGRFFIPRANLDTSDAFCLGVVTDAATVIEEATALLPTASVAALCDDVAWTKTPSNRRYDEAARVTWSRVFDPEAIQSGTREGTGGRG